MTINITPNHVTLESGDVIETSDPIRTVLEHPDAIDATVEAEDGLYPAPQKWIEAIRPRVVRAKGNAFHIAGSDKGDTLSFVSSACSDIRWENVVFHGPTVKPGQKSYGLQTWMNQGPYHDWNFVNCAFDGGYNWSTGEGTYCHAMVSLNMMEGLSFTNCIGHGVRGEQIIYLRDGSENPSSGVLFDGCELYGSGRSLIQKVSRKENKGGGPTLGEFRVRNCSFRDGGLGEGGGMLTVNGQAGTTFVEGSSFAQSEEGNALTIWSERDLNNKPEPKLGFLNGSVSITDCTIGGKTDREAVMLSAIEALYMSGTTIESGKAAGHGNATAVGFNGASGGDLFPVKQILEAKEPNDIKGNVVTAGGWNYVRHGRWQVATKTSDLGAWLSGS